MICNPRTIGFCPVGIRVKDGTKLIIITGKFSVFLRHSTYLNKTVRIDLLTSLGRTLSFSLTFVKGQGFRWFDLLHYS